MIASPTPAPAQVHEYRPLNEGPPLPGSPPPKRMSMVSRSSSHDVPGSPRLASVAVFPNNPEASSPTQSHAPGDLSRSSTLRRPQKPIPEAPLKEAEETQLETETSHDAPVSNPNRNSYILPAPVSRRPLPALARPPSIHQITENRKSIVGVTSPAPHLPSVPSEPEHVEDIEEAAEHTEPVVEASHHIDEKHAEDTHVESPEAIHTETKEENVEDPVASHEEHDEAHAETQEAGHAAEEEEETPTVEEKEPEKPKLPEIESSGPALSHASRPRPAKGRKPPSAPLPNAENTSFVSQLEAEVKAVRKLASYQFNIFSMLSNSHITILTFVVVGSYCGRKKARGGTC